jgi:hypothetical protein
MKRKTLLAVGMALWCSGSAYGQAGVLYRLEQGSTLTAEHCLPPCMCPSGPQTAALTGTFTLTKTGEIPWFAVYSVTGAEWSAAFVQGPVAVRGEGTYMIGGHLANTHELNLVLVVLDSPISDPQAFTSGVIPVGSGNPFPRIGITTQSEQRGCTRYAVAVVAAPVPCQADCDASGALTANDFTCFVNKFAAGDPYANCDGSTADPRLTGNDFLCYLNRFAAGCP